MRISNEGRFSVFAVVCIGAYLGTARADDPKVRDTETLTGSRVFEDALKDESSETINADFDAFEKKLIPIKSPKATRNGYALPVEPDAEMLPAHYTGVKPPGVDHMELKHAESRVLEINPNAKPSVRVAASPIISKQFVQGGGAQRASAKEAAEVGERTAERKKVATFEKGTKGEQETKKSKKEYSEAGGKKGTRSESDSGGEYREDGGKGHEGASHAVKDAYGKDHKSSGFRNVYHKDEYKKDADFYDNDDHGGHFKKHGRYNEKHTAHEATHKKGSSGHSDFDQGEVNKEGESKKAQVNREAKGHVGGQGYDGFFKNFQGFARQGGNAQVKKFGFADGKVA